MEVVDFEKEEIEAVLKNQSCKINFLHCVQKLKFKNMILSRYGCYLWTGGKWNQKNGKADWENDGGQKGEGQTSNPRRCLSCYLYW